MRDGGGGASQFPGRPTHRIHFGGNWITDAYLLKEGTTVHSDMIDRMRYNASFETEEHWSSVGYPTFLGVVEGKVRVLRVVQGAASGVYTTKYESIYGTQFVTRLNMRAHEGVPYIEARVNHDEGIIRTDRPTSDAYVWTETRWDDTAPNNAPLDLVDGVWPDPPPSFPAQAYDDWTEVPSEARGAYVHLSRELRPVPAASRKYIYDDRSSPVRTGEHGRRWDWPGNTEDGKDNDGCSVLDPESPQLHFARTEQVFVPQPLREDASAPGLLPPPELMANDRLPVLALTRKQIHLVPLPTPVTPCPPSLVPQTTGTGAVDLTMSAAQCPGVSGFRIYRAPVGGGFAFLKDVGAATTYTDWTTRHGVTYRYVATTYNSANAESAYSQEVSIVAQDSTAPAIPTAVLAFPGNAQATVDWAPVYDTDRYGYNIYVAMTSGGPYNKLTSSPTHASQGTQWTQAGLQNGWTYYFTVSSIDIAGNESAKSVEAVVTPGP